MAIRINEYVVGGELRNTTRNSVFGHIYFAPEYGIGLELTGNLKGQFQGKHFSFRVSGPAFEEVAIEDLPEHIELLANFQIGVIGSVELRQVRIPCVPIDEFIARSKLGEQPPCDLKDCLYLEWFSQNGRVVAEITDLEIEFINDDSNETFTPRAEPIPGLNESNNFDPDDSNDSEQSGISITSIRIDDDGNSIIEEVEMPQEDGADEYNLLDADLDQEIRHSLESGPKNSAPQDDPTNGVTDVPYGSDSNSSSTRSWDEVIPGIDPETKAMYEQWDEIYHGENEESVMPLFEGFQLPHPDSLFTDEEAEPHLDLILMRLATFNVAIDLCKHMTPLSAYQMLMKEILPEATVNPNLATTEIIQHYSTWESCPQCDAEFEEEYQSRKSEDD